MRVLIATLLVATGCTTFQIASEPEVVESTRSPNLAIPDDDDGGVTDLAPVAEPCEVFSVEVDVEVRHEYRGDLFAEITSPAGTLVILKMPANEDGNLDLVGTFPTTLEPVQPLDYEGEEGMGSWALRVGDLGEGDIGTLVTWTLRLECF